MHQTCTICRITVDRFEQYEEGLQGQIFVLQTNVNVRKLETPLVFRLQSLGQVNSQSIHHSYLKQNPHDRASPWFSDCTNK